LRQKPNKFFPYTLILAIVAFDQSSKFLAQKYLAISCNRGFALGISEVPLVVLLAILTLLGYFFIQEKNWISILSFSLILGGGIANFIDRLTVGCVRDFINFRFVPGLTWIPSFNLADVAISVGAGILVIRLLTIRRR